MLRLLIAHPIHRIKRFTRITQSHPRLNKLDHLPGWVGRCLKLFAHLLARSCPSGQIRWGVQIMHKHGCASTGRKRDRTTRREPQRTTQDLFTLDLDTVLVRKRL